MYIARTPTFHWLHRVKFISGLINPNLMQRGRQSVRRRADARTRPTSKLTTLFPVTARTNLPIVFLNITRTAIDGAMARWCVGEVRLLVKFCFFVFLTTFDNSKPTRSRSRAAGRGRLAPPCFATKSGSASRSFQILRMVLMSVERARSW